MSTESTISIFEDVRKELIVLASESMKHLQQYNGHFDDYILVRVKKSVKSKLGQSFEADEIAIARPIVYYYNRIGGKLKGNQNLTMVVWSQKVKCDTHININNIYIYTQCELKLEALQ